MEAFTGRQVWKVKADQHPAATLTATPAYYNGTPYVPNSSFEEAAAFNASYTCCTFRGSLVAMDAATGREKWRTWLVDEPKPEAPTIDGAAQMGPSGVPVWNTPAIDPGRNQLTIGTGDNNIGLTGLSEAAAGAAGFNPITSLIRSRDKARYYPGARDLNLKLVADGRDGRLLVWSRATRGSGDYAILTADPMNPASRRVAWQGSGAVGPADISADNRQVLVARGISNRETRLMLLDLVLIGRQAGLGFVFGLGLAAAAALFAYQHWLIRAREPAACLKAFLNNQWAGLAIFLGIAGDYALRAAQGAGSPIN